MAVNTREALSGDILGGMQSFRWGKMGFNLGLVKAVWSSLVNLPFRYCFSMGCFRLTMRQRSDLFSIEGHQRPYLDGRELVRSFDRIGADVVLIW